MTAITRRHFAAVLGGVVTWPLAARAQQPAMPVVGFLNSAPPEAFPDRLRAFHRGLKDAGFVEGSAELVRLKVAVMLQSAVPLR